MIVIKKHRQHKVPTLNMTSMPDLIFTVLFFFMIVTHMRTETPKLKVETPQGKELTDPTNKRLLVNLYVGQSIQGETLIQIGNNIVPLHNVGSTVASLRSRLNEDEAQMFTVNIRADRRTNMGLIADIKRELRKVGALNIRYSAEPKKE